MSDRRHSDFRWARNFLAGLTVGLAALVCFAESPTSASADTFGLGPATVAEDVAFSGDGGVIVAGATTACESLSFVSPACGPGLEALARYGSDGALDPDFGGDGVVVDPAGQSQTGIPVSVLPSQSGGLIVAGNRTLNPLKGATYVERLDSSGKLDSAFGSGGTVAIDPAPFGRANFVLRGAALQADGNVVLVGVATDIGPAGGAVAVDAGLVRLLPNGQPDPGFGVNGYVSADFGGNGPFRSEPVDVVVLPSGGIRLLVRGGPTEPVKVAGFDASGAVDTSFGGGTGVAAVLPVQSGSRLDPTALVPDGQGRMVVGVGETNDASHSPCARQLVVRVLAGGTRDSSFGSDGVVDLDKLRCSFLSGLAIGPSGQIATAGAVNELVYPGELARPPMIGVQSILPNGMPDPSFGPVGTAVPGAAVAPVGKTAATVAGLLAQPDGKFVVAGTAGIVNTPTFTCHGVDPALIGTHCSAFALARFLPDGSLDPEYGEGGVVMTPKIRVCKLERFRAKLTIAKRSRKLGLRLRYSYFEGGTIHLSVRRVRRVGFSSRREIIDIRLPSRRFGSPALRRWVEIKTLSRGLLRHPNGKLQLVAQADKLGGECLVTLPLRRVKGSRSAISYVTD